jgi:plasmid stability protein
MAKKPTVKRAGRDSDQFMVRLPDGMREALAELAARNGRSMNAEIVHALAVHFANEASPTESQLSAIETRIKVLLDQLANRHQEITELIIKKADTGELVQLIKKGIDGEGGKKRGK